MRNHFILHIPSLSLNPLFIALVVIKCAMCTSIQVVCTPKPPLCALQSCQNHLHSPSFHLPSAKINISYSILFNLTTSYSSYFGGKKGISRNKTSFFLLMAPHTAAVLLTAPSLI